jgi:hypothetical protein
VKHSGVVDAHLRCNSHDFPASITEPAAELCVFCCDDIFTETADLSKSFNAYQKISGARFTLAEGGVPFHITQCVVYGEIWSAFAAPSVNNSDILVLFEESKCDLKPSGVQLAVPVKELSVSKSPTQLADALEASVTRACGCKWLLRAKLDYFDTRTARF